MQNKLFCSPPYESPEISLVSLGEEDVICASSGINLPDVSLEIFGETEII